MGVFQASIKEAMQSLRDEIKSVKKKTSQAELDQISASDPKPGPSKQPNDLPSYPNTPPDIQTLDKSMETDYLWACLTTTVWCECSVGDRIGSKQIGSEL